MEKIKKAMELARAQAQGDTGSEIRAESADHSPHTNTDGKINYSQTRVIPINAEVLKRNKIIVNGEPEQASTAYKILRTQVEHRLAANNWNVVAVTSPGAGHGKTLTAINLSVALAKEIHRTVLLVDLNLRKPCIHERFEHHIEHGLVDYLLDDLPLSQILSNPGIDRLVVLPAGRPTSNSSELLASPKMIRLVEELKSRYPSRIIVCDLPALLSTDDMLAFSPFVDATLLVVEDGVTTKDELVRAVEMMKGVHLLGTVLNNVSREHGHAP